MARKNNDIVLAPLEDGNQKYAIRSNADIVCFTGGTGGGKEMPLDEPVLTVNGWKQMGDIRIGDELVAPLNREPSVVTGIYPQGVKPIYKITTSDGRTSRCGLEHLWRIYTEKQVENQRKGKTQSFFVKTTKEIIDEYLNSNKRVFLPVARPYEGKEKDLPIDPYVLGVWLGDGCCGHIGFVVSNDEGDIIEKISNRLGSIYRLHSNHNYNNRIYKNENVTSAINYLNAIGLNVYSRKRFIPQEYLHASIEQRMELLKGLMDSDGNVEEKNRFSFSTTSTKLKDGFVELCRGLGYVVGVHKDKRTRYESGVGWDISIQTNDIIFSSKKHLSRYYANLEKYKNKNREYKHDFIRIVSIEYIGDMEAQCIMVSNKDHLYITNDYIVTHNTIALYYSPIDYLAMNDNAKIVCFMRNVSDFWGSGKVADSLKKMYPLIDRSIKKQPHDPIGEIIRRQEDMGMKLYNGSEIKFQQLDNENPIVIDKIAKGLQAKKLIFDECNKFQWRTISSFFPRLRSDSGGKAQIFLAQNPERECFMRKMCGKGEHGGGWINDDGTIDKSMDGVVMFFCMPNGDYEKAVWGRTKREVYEKCKEHIDSLLAVDEDMTYEDFVLSMVFYTFDVRDNKKMLAKNKGYRGLAANSATAQSAYAVNWNYSLEDEKEEIEDLADVEISTLDIERMFKPMPIPPTSILEKRFMTMDIATTGFDNLVMMYWEKWSDYGFICKDIKFSMHNDDREVGVLAINFRDKHNLQERDMILDVQGYTYLKSVFVRAMLFTGAGSVSNRGRNQFLSMKDEASHLTMQMIKMGLIHFAPELANMRYNHKNMIREGGTTILKHLNFERVIFQFRKTPNGRLEIMPKTEMKKLLKGFSPDLTDNIIMLCGALCYDCHRMLRDESGAYRKRVETQDMLTMLNINGEQDRSEPYEQPKKIKDVSEILNILHL